MASVNFKGLVGDSYRARSGRFNASKTVNLYPEMGDASLSPNKLDQVAVLMSVPGKTGVFTADSEVPCRGLWQPSNSPSVLYGVFGSTVYQFVEDSNDVLVGTALTGALITTEGQVSIADNGLQVCLVDGQYGYFWGIGGNTVTQLVSANFYPADTVDYLDGYLLFNRSGTTECFFSDINAVTFSSLNTFKKVSSSDNVIGLKVNVGQIYLFGEKNTEVWQNVGGAITPFQRVPGKYIPFGCVSPGTIKTLNGTIIWLGRSLDGTGIVYSLQQDVATRVSTHAVEFALQQSTELSKSFAYTQQIDGHLFWNLQVPDLPETWCLDNLRPAWHTRQSNRDGVMGLDRAYNHALFKDKHIVGGDDGKLYRLDYETYTDGDAPLVRIRRAPHLANALDRVFHNLLEIDFRFGVGLENGEVPNAVLRISDDGGLNFGPDIPTSLGQVGDYLQKARWYRLGYSYDRVYEVYVSDPVRVEILSAKIEAETGDS